MKIAFIVNSYPPRMGGLEQHLGNLAQGLTKNGVEVTVFTIGDNPGVRRDDDVVVRTGKRYFPIADIISFPALGTRRALSRVLRDQGYDLVSVHTRFFPMSLIGVLAAKSAGIPAMHTEHGSGFVAASSPLISLASRMVDQTIGRFVLRSADMVLGVSAEAAAFAKKLGARMPRVFFNAIPDFPAPLEVEDRPQHLVFVGRMVPGKGWDTFLHAIKELLAQGIDVTGELLGDGDSLPEVRELIQTMGLTDRVVACGRVDVRRVHETLRGATLVNPTVLSEGFQTTLLEALSERGRVVTYDVPGARLLQSEGAPVVITEQKSLEALVSALRSFLSDPPPVIDYEALSSWRWPARSKQYMDLAGEVIRSHPAKKP